MIVQGVREGGRGGGVCADPEDWQRYKILYRDIREKKIRSVLRIGDCLLSILGKVYGSNDA